MRLVLDTNVVASALLWGGTPRRLLRAGREKRIELLTSLPLLAELTDILGRRKFEKKIAASMLSVDTYYYFQRARRNPFHLRFIQHFTPPSSHTI